EAGEKAAVVYGTAGYTEFSPFPEVTLAGVAAEDGTMIPIHPDLPEGAPAVNVVMRIEEGRQFFINRLTFTGNTTTRDSVIRREMRVVEGGVFNTEALKYSVRRLNQLGYFKPLEDVNAVKVEPV